MNLRMMKEMNEGEIERSGVNLLLWNRGFEGRKKVLSGQRDKHKGEKGKIGAL